MSEFVHRQPARSDDADNPLRIVQTIPAPAAIVGDFEQRFGVTCIDGYGLTDVGMVAFRRHDEPLVAGSSGTPMATFELMIADPDTDVALPAGEIGEILLRPCVADGFMRGYWNRPEATIKAWRNLWFHTGDAGFLDSAGRLHFCDRLGTRSGCAGRTSPRPRSKRWPPAIRLSSNVRLSQCRPTSAITTCYWPWSWRRGTTCTPPTWSGSAKGGCRTSPCPVMSNCWRNFR